MKQQTNPTISAMTGSEALPRQNGELIFHDEWEKRAFALAVALCEQGQFAWDDFRGQLVISIAKNDETAQDSDTSATGYFEHWLVALESTLDKQDLFSSDQNSG